MLKHCNKFNSVNLNCELVKLNELLLNRPSLFETPREYDTMQSVQHLEQCACMLYKSGTHSTLWWNSVSFMLCGQVNKPLFNIVKQNIKYFDAAKFERFFHFNI